MQKLTKNVGNSNINVKSDPSFKVERILICRPNHRLGNLLLTTPLIQDVSDAFPNSKIDLLAKGGLANAVFKNYKNINLIINLPKKPFKELGNYISGWMSLRKTRYDLVINVVKGSSSGRLTAQFAYGKYKFFGDDNEQAESTYPDKHMAKLPVYYFRHCLSQLGLPETNRPVPLMDLKLSEEELHQGKETLKKLNGNDKPTICLFTYATGDKCYSKDWWNPFYDRLKKEYTDFNVIEILPVENVSMISFQAPTYSHKDIRNVGSVIANTSVFIGADSGVMHLASAVQVPTVGLFSITSPDSYRPYNPLSFGINTNESKVDDYINIVNSIVR